MGLLDRLRSPSSLRATYAPWDNFWYQGPASRSGIEGITVSPETALRQLSMVWTCVKAKSYDMASLSLFLYRLLDRGKERAKDRPLYRVLHVAPNNWQTPFELEQMSQTHLCLRGNFYARIVDDGRGNVASLIPFNPDRIVPELLPAGIMRYTHRKPGGGDEILMQNEVHHRRGLTVDGIKGLSEIEASEPTLARAMATEKYASDFYNGGTAPPFALRHPLTMGAEAIKNLRDSLAKYKAGDKFLILEEAMEATQLGVSARDAQLLEVQEHGDEQIARIFGMPPSRVGITKAGAVSYASSEMQDLSYVKYVIGALAKSNEEAMTRDLLSTTEQDGFVIEYLLDSLLRGDSAARASFYASGIEHQWFVPNEARERENLNALPGGDDVVQMPKSQTPQAPQDQTPRTPTGKPRGEWNTRAELVTIEACARIVRTEIAAATHAAKKYASDPKGWQTWCGEFYDDHAEFLGQVLKLPSHQARAYAGTQRDALQTKGVPVMADWERRIVPELAGLALGDEHHV